MSRFHILQVVPYLAARALDDLFLLFGNALTDMGHECNGAVNQSDPGRVNLVLGPNLIHPSLLKGTDYIAYQTEQLSEPERFAPQLTDVLAGAKQIWDYSRHNIEILRSKGFEALHVPPGYHPWLNRIGEAPIHFQALFFGAVSPYRLEILAGIAREGVQITNLCGVFGEDRDRFISHSRMNLNLHYSDQDGCFEAVRVSLLLNNRRLVVSEPSADYPYPGVEIPMIPSRELPGYCASLTEDAVGCGRIAGEAGEQFAELYPMTRILKVVL